jgi:hypothetical protein
MTSTTAQLYAQAVARRREALAWLDVMTEECRELARQLKREQLAAAEAATKARKL